MKGKGRLCCAEIVAVRAQLEAMKKSAENGPDNSSHSRAFSQIFLSEGDVSVERKYLPAFVRNREIQNCGGIESAIDALKIEF
jgi:hypothetical protein